ncbi:MAG: triose-phosphate isomerase [Candidatus Roizmanbacteria bacterium]|nr:triose-phosphate isomerase [Candidatus Roizmanbacteria bacterium]
MKYILGNWKANKNFTEMKQWIYTFQREYRANETVTLGVFPPLLFISYVQGKLKDCKNVFVGSQTISSFEKGSYTGDVTATTLEGVAYYSIIGHSERRKIFGETDEQLAEKVKQALAHGEPPEQTVAMKKKMNLPKDVVFIYGGSVNEKNASDYFATGEIDGFLIGKACLDPVQFIAIAKAAQ